MNRADLLAALEILLDPTPVVGHPLDAAIVPAVVLEGSNRTRQPAWWQASYVLTGIAGRADDTDVYDTAETLQNAVCLALDKLPGISDPRQDAQPDMQRIGEVDYLTFHFTFTDHNVVGPCST